MAQVAPGLYISKTRPTVVMIFPSRRHRYFRYECRKHLGRRANPRLTSSHDLRPHKI